MLKMRWFCSASVVLTSIYDTEYAYLELFALALVLVNVSSFAGNKRNSFAYERLSNLLIVFIEFMISSPLVVNCRAWSFGFSKIC